MEIYFVVSIRISIFACAIKQLRLKMSTKEKLILRFLTLPKDFTYDEVVRLFAIFGFEEYSKGSTSGSRVQFYRNDGQSYIMHKPHPSAIIKPTALKQLADYIKDQNLIKEYYDKKH